MHLQATSVRNHLLASLPSKIVEELLPKLNLIKLENRRQLYLAEDEIDFVYFVESGMISVVYTFENGEQAEVGLIGRDGMLGAFAVSGINLSFFDAMVQMPGTALRMTIRDFQSTIETVASFKNALLRYNEMLQAQAMQTAACNGHHRIEQRLARWLLMASDQMQQNELPLTQDFLAIMLGVHRPSVTVIAGGLQRSGLIGYKAGHIAILDRLGLEAVTCECYRVNRRRSELISGRSLKGSNGFGVAEPMPKFPVIGDEESHNL